MSYRWLFWRMERNYTPNSHQKIWRTNCLRTGVLLGVISNNHRVRINPEDPMDVRNDPPKGTHPQDISASNFLMWIWWVISFHSLKKSPVLKHTPSSAEVCWLSGLCNSLIFKVCFQVLRDSAFVNQLLQGSFKCSWSNPTVDVIEGNDKFKISLEKV